MKMTGKDKVRNFKMLVTLGSQRPYSSDCRTSLKAIRDRVHIAHVHFFARSLLAGASQGLGLLHSAFTVFKHCGMHATFSSAVLPKQKETNCPLTLLIQVKRPPRNFFHEN